MIFSKADFCFPALTLPDELDRARQLRLEIERDTERKSHAEARSRRHDDAEYNDDYRRRDRNRDRHRGRDRDHDSDRRRDHSERDRDSPTFPPEGYHDIKVALECLLKVVIEVSLRGDGGDRDINIFVQKSLFASYVLSSYIPFFPFVEYFYYKSCLSNY
ncbi:uncharacterized protein LOC109705064 isoform X2 [Ananas comosus]|uniref:Uncharacterized protein LOC109705064 isoform X2 n=1 Tax=Ananas comosus TaxID=4615 RepID=A0A6P5EIV3_ANACO|nr:uncharacterized protein LOC109705064 isoform X2 [Ananas comosus]XP_020081417.1 uncharacterized protein LOC109705064 isoform X2 [Ananas comosus]XP_020081418.1 uncharacterized protein LOC109705064 isoform X2 [Ananas comosus]